MPKKARISGSFNTLRRMIASGSDRAMTAIIKAKTVPKAAPLPKSACTMGIISAALEYMGTPKSTATGTDHQASLPIKEAVKFSGTYPWIPALTAIPRST